MGEFRVISVLSPREPTRGPREAGRLLMARFGGPAAGTNSPTTADPQNGVNVSSSAGEKSQLQALGRGHETVHTARGRPALVEYRCGGTLAYLTA